MAKYLRIEVRRNGERKVWLTMPGTSVEDLSGIMDEEVVAKVTEQGIDLDAIVRDARRSGYYGAVHTGRPGAGQDRPRLDGLARDAPSNAGSLTQKHRRRRVLL